MAYSLSPLLKPRFFVNATNKPLVGGKLYTYLAETTTPATTYSNDTGTPNTNPIILDANGECNLYLDDDKVYRLILKDANDVTYFDKDRVSSIGGGDYKVLTFNTIDDLRLKIGSEKEPVAQTSGYYAAGDGGGNRFYWDGTSSALDNGGTIIKPTFVSGAGRWLAVDSYNATVKQFGARANTLFNDSSVFSTAFNSGVKRIYIESGDYKLSSTINVTSSVEIVGKQNASLIVDWTSLGAGAKVFNITASDTKIKDLEFNVLSTPIARNNDAAAACVYVNADDCLVDNCVFVEQPTSVYSVKSNARIVVRNCHMTGMFDGLSESSYDNHGIHISDGEKCELINNYIANYPQGILFGLSTNNSIVSGNTGYYCSNHTVYVSSGDNNLIDSNIAIGTYNNIKARGDFNTISNNKVFGGTIGLTNRIADGAVSLIGDTNAFHGGTISGNHVMCARPNAYGISLDEKSGSPAVLRNVSIIGNTIYSKNASPDVMFRGINVGATGLENISIVGNNIDTVAGDGIIVTTLPFVIANSKRIVISNNCVSNCVDNAIQATGDQCVISSNTAYNSDATGTNSGLIYCALTNSQIVNNTLNDSNGGSGAAIREFSTSNNNFISGNIYQSCAGGIVKVGANTLLYDVLIGSTIWDPASIASGATATTTVTVTGAVLGDFVDNISFNRSLSGLTLSGYVSASNTVTVVLSNNTGGSVDLSSGTLSVRVNHG